MLALTKTVQVCVPSLPNAYGTAGKTLGDIDCSWQVFILCSTLIVSVIVVCTDTLNPMNVE